MPNIGSRATLIFPMAWSTKDGQMGTQTVTLIAEVTAIKGSRLEWQTVEEISVVNPLPNFDPKGFYVPSGGCMLDSPRAALFA